MVTANLILILAIIFILIYLASTLLLYFLKGSKKKEEVPDWGTTQAYEVVENATKKAEELISSAEADSLKIATSAKMGTELFESEYNKKLGGVLEKAQADFSKKLEESMEHYKSLISSLEQTSQETQKETEEAMRTRINAALLNFEQNLSNYLSQAEQKSFESINLELKSARSLIDTYKQQQLELIDENIVAVLERTLSIVLRDKLSLKDQMDMVFEALEKAKIEKFFA